MQTRWTQYSLEFWNALTKQWDWTEWKELTDDIDFSDYPYAVEFRVPPKEDDVKQ